LTKRIKLPWETTGLQFRGEMFNAFNHTNFNALGTTFGSSTFGILRSKDADVSRRTDEKPIVFHVML